MGNQEERSQQSLPKSCPVLLEIRRYWREVVERKEADSAATRLDRQDRSAGKDPMAARATLNGPKA